MKSVTGYRRWLAGLSLLLLLPACAAAGEHDAFTESVVIFNTVCARCHEGECSGRLGFENAGEASAGHIARHYNPAAGKERLQRELFVILEYMKAKCAYYPMQAPVPASGVWDSSLLERMTASPESSYFVPLGPLSAGSYRIGLDLERDAEVAVQLVSEQFEMVADERLASSDRQLDIPFSIEVPGNYYFRMYPREPVRISRLAITSSGNGSDRPSREPGRPRPE